MNAIDDAASIVQAVRDCGLAGTDLRRFAIEQISQLPGYDSNYLYLLEGNALVLEHYVGEPTEHTTIPVGRGICGTAVSEGANQVIADVSEIENYLSCSLKTRSEIVVLIRSDSKILGQIDVDGHTVGTFGQADEMMLEQIAAVLADRW